MDTEPTTSGYELCTTFYEPGKIKQDCQGGCWFVVDHAKVCKSELTLVCKIILKSKIEFQEYDNLPCCLPGLSLICLPVYDQPGTRRPIREYLGSRER